jgi:hypothetical protein
VGAAAASGGALLGKFHTVTCLSGLSRLSFGNAMRRGVIVVDAARVTTFRALVLWALRLTHRRLAR